MAGTRKVTDPVAIWTCTGLVSAKAHVPGAATSLFDQVPSGRGCPGPCVVAPERSAAKNSAKEKRRVRLASHVC